MNSRSTLGRAALALLLAATVLPACTPERDPATLFAPEAVGVLVIDAVLIVDEPLPSVRLSRTLPPNVPYTSAAAAERGAVVVVRTAQDEVPYEEHIPNAVEMEPYYRPDVSILPRVLPGTRYEVTVTTSRGEVLTAATTTPEHFAITEWVLLANDGQTRLRTLKTFADGATAVWDDPDNRLTYPEGLLDARFAGRAVDYGAAGFQLALFSLDPDAALVIDPPFISEEDLATLPRNGASPALNGEDGYVRLPWFGIFYEGRYLYKAFAVDRNWFDLVRSVPQGGSFGFGGNVGDGTDRPIFHVQGGIGLFGSASVDSTGFTINPAP